MYGLAVIVIMSLSVHLTNNDEIKPYEMLLHNWFHTNCTCIELIESPKKDRLTDWLGLTLAVESKSCRTAWLVMYTGVEYILYSGV